MSSASIDQLPRKSCSKCGVRFGCGATVKNTDCWCTKLPHVAPVADPDQDCLCPACLAEAITKLTLKGIPAGDAPIVLVSSEAPLVEDEDYYLEGTAMVFTAQFLLRRGYCCESGCRHCPFDATAQSFAFDLE